VAKSQEEQEEPVEAIPFSVDQLIENAKKTFEFLADFKNLNFECQSGNAYTRIVKGDKGRLDKVIYCLLSNSFKFTK